MPRPLVSVIVPAYNAERYITDTLASVLAQTYRDTEIIVVDDGSTDDTRQRMLAFGERVRYVRQPNSGGCASPRNHGARLASGELLAFIDSDDLMSPRRIERQVAFLRDHRDAAMVFSNYRDFDACGLDDGDHFARCPLLSAVLRRAPGGTTGVTLPSGPATDLLLTENFGSSSPMVRRSTHAAVGGFDESLRASEDYDYAYRIAARFAVGVLPSVDWYKRRHGASMSANVENILRFKIVTRERILEKERAASRRRALASAIAGYHLDLAFHYTGRDNTLATRHLRESLRYRLRPSPRHYVRLLLDVLGRDTLGARRTGGR